MLAADVASAIALRSWETRRRGVLQDTAGEGGGGYDSPCFPAKGPGTSTRPTSPSPTVS